MVARPDEAGELRTYLIMERINPPTVKQIQMRNGETKVLNCISELGIFSSIFVRNDSTNTTQEVLRNQTLGTLMRTKSSHDNEGGVNAGFAVIDSLFIVGKD